LGVEANFYLEAARVMPVDPFISKMLLPELRFSHTTHRPKSATTHMHAVKESQMEVCPNCATPSQSVYDRRRVKLKDSPIRQHQVLLHIVKRRFMCKPCGRPFTEPIPGVSKGARTTERYRKGLLWACENFSDLKAVRQQYRCSYGMLYKTLYQQLELKRRTRLYPWPKVLGIDEHFFGRGNGGFRQFVSMIVDFKGRRLMEVVEGRTVGELEAALKTIPGRDNVQLVAMDLCEPFRSFVQGFFPSAKIVADHFHVVRLLHPAINRRRKEITGDKRSAAIRRLLLRNGGKLTWTERRAVERWLTPHSQLREVYEFKERVHALYRTRGYDRAAAALTRITDDMARSQLPEIATLRKTLMRWRNEVLEYFRTPITNGRTEGFNNKAKVVKRRGYGYRSFRNYRLRLLNACSG
jgi:transposase